MASQCTDSSEAAYHSKGGKLGSIRGWNFRPTPARHQEKKKVCVRGVVVGCGGGGIPTATTKNNELDYTGMELII